jgi:hypothetical protein
VPASSAADLPIDDYDALKVNEILPLLDDLDLDELEAVAQHEETTKNRTTILNRIDDRMDELEAEEAGTPTTVNDIVTDELAEAAADSIEEVGEPVVATGATAASAAGSLPIAGFGSMSESEAIAALQSLDADDLETIADYEEAHENRDAVLDAIDDRLDVLEGIVPAPAPVAAAATPAKKTPAKKAPAKKATAKKAAATPAKAPARKATPTTAARKAAAPAKKTAAAPAKKATTTAKKAAAAPAKKASTAAKASTPARKATTTAAKKATAAPKKAAPVKKATTAKKATKR